MWGTWKSLRQTYQFLSHQHKDIIEFDVCGSGHLAIKFKKRREEEPLPNLKDHQHLESGRKDTATKDPKREFLLWSGEAKGK